MWTSYGTGRYFSGENDVICRNSLYNPPKAAILHIHGVESGNGAVDWMNVSSRQPLFRAMTQAGFVIVSCDLGGSSTWGNDTAQSRITSAYNYSQSLPGISAGKVILFGQSMGGLNAQIWAKNNKSLTSGMVLVIPVCNLTDLSTGVFSSAINAAYGGAYSQATHGATRNPVTFAASLEGIPIQLWYGTSDSLCKPEDAQTIGGLVSTAELHPIAGGHAESTLGNIDLIELTRFINLLTP